MALCKRVSLTSLLVLCVFLCVLCAAAIIALVIISATALDGQNKAEIATAEATAQYFGETGLQSIYTVLNNDRSRASMIVKQMLPYFRTAAATPEDALALYNATFAELFLPRMLQDEIMAFRWHFYYPALPAITTTTAAAAPAASGPTAATTIGQVQSLHAFIDEQLSGDVLHLVSWTDTDGNNDVFTVSFNATARAIDFDTGTPLYTSATNYAEVAQSLLDLNDWERAQLWRSMDGHLHYFVSYSATLRPFGDDSLVVIPQVLISAANVRAWFLSTLGTAVNDTFMSLVDETLRVIADTTVDVTDDVLQNARCGTSSTAGQALLGTEKNTCHEMYLREMTEYASNPELLALATDIVAQVHEGANASAVAVEARLTTTTTTNEGGSEVTTGRMVDGNNRVKYVMVSQIAGSGRLYIYAILVGNGPQLGNAQKATTVVFSILGSLVVVGIVFMTLCIYGLVTPLRSTIEALLVINSLDTDAMLARVDRDDAAEDAAFDPQACHGGDITTEGALLTSVAGSLAAAVLSFGRFMPMDIVRELLSTHSLAKVSLKVVNLHILFVDVASFTTASEQLSQYPGVLSVLLNRFFTSTCDSVALWGGTVDKFIGDCVMAFWGAPKPHAYSATAALLTALHIVRSVGGGATDAATIQRLIPHIIAHPADAAVDLRLKSGGFMNPAMLESTTSLPKLIPTIPSAASVGNTGAAYEANNLPTALRSPTTQGAYELSMHSVDNFSMSRSADPELLKTKMPHRLTTTKSVGPTVSGSSATGTSGKKRAALQLDLGKGSGAGGGGAADAVEEALLAAARQAPIKVRIGMHGGMVNVGNMGCAQRLSYTALGDAVNTASRLEGFVKRLQGPCDIICGATTAAEAHPALIARYVGPVRVVGKAEAIDVWQPIAFASLHADEAAAMCRLAATSTHGGQTPRDGCGRECGTAADAAIATFLADTPQIFDSHVLGLMADFNDASRRAQEAAMRHAEAPQGHRPASSFDTPASQSVPAPVGDFPADPEVAAAVEAMRAAYCDLPSDLQAQFAWEDSFLALRSPSGAIECDAK